MDCLKTNRKPCKECPWENRHKHSQDWQKYSLKMTEVGKIKDRVHNCHMITKDTWGFEEGVTEKTVCAGALKKQKMHSS